MRVRQFQQCGSVLVLVGLFATACSNKQDRIPPWARPDIVETFRQDLATNPHPADGGGRAWVEWGPRGEEPVVAGTYGRWVIWYEAGPLGVADGGWVFLQVSPFWGWSTPQVFSPDVPGYTEVSTSAPGVVLDAQTLDEQLLGIRISGQPLEAGERLRIEYGAGSHGARADRFAERDSYFWISVDGDGDGVVRSNIADSPRVEVIAGPPARLMLTLPSTARVGETVTMTATVLDGLGNAWMPITGALVLEGPPEGLRFTTRSSFEVADEGRLTLDITVRENGVYRLKGTGPGGLSAESNPLLVSGGPRVVWGDLHGHSGYSDGTGTPRDYFRYARDIAALDIVALTDHDHWGMKPLATHPEIWEEIRRETQLFNQPERFVTLLGYEWTNWIYGHRHVLYFSDHGEVLSSINSDYQHPTQLWAALRGQDALTFAHHSAGGPIATDWGIAPDPELEPVTEIVSAHGSSESEDSPTPIYAPMPGNFVRHALARGYRFGFIGSGDSHDGHPGLTHLASPQSGLAAVILEDLTREGVLEALRSRRVYATNGPRILLRAELDNRPMGSTLEHGGAASLDLRATAIAPEPLETIDVIRSGQIATRFKCEGNRACTLELEVPPLQIGEYLYLRAVQENGGAAWSSPFFTD